MFDLTPLTTEKTTHLGTLKKYAFFAPKNFTKIDVKREIAALYGVAVTRVGVINTVSKMRGLGTRRPGVKRPEQKKFIITVKTDKPLDFTKVVAKGHSRS